MLTTSHPRRIDVHQHSRIDVHQHSQIDVHQHIWTAPLVDALERRDRLPFVRRTDGIVILHCAGEPAWAIDIDAESPDRRAALHGADDIDQALVALSSPIGIEALPREEAETLIEAHLSGVEALGDGFAAWGPVALEHPDPDDVDARLQRGCIGISLPAGALADPDALAAIDPLLARAEAIDAPLFVHPGPGRHQPARDCSLTEPLWWTALTDYVAQMQAAWLTFAAAGRREHPRLRILFAMLAGGAPLHAERLAARGGPPVDLRDPLTFYETSSYGLAAIKSVAERVGATQLVYGSDRPVIEPVRTEHDAFLQTNASRLIAPVQPAVAA